MEEIQGRSDEAQVLRLSFRGLAPRVGNAPWEARSAAAVGACAAAQPRAVSAESPRSALARVRQAACTYLQGGLCPGPGGLPGERVSRSGGHSSCPTAWKGCSSIAWPTESRFRLSECPWDGVREGGLVVLASNEPVTGRHPGWLLLTARPLGYGCRRCSPCWPAP